MDNEYDNIYPILLQVKAIYRKNKQKDSLQSTLLHMVNTNVLSGESLKQFEDWAAGLKDRRGVDLEIKAFLDKYILKIGFNQ